MDEIVNKVAQSSLQVFDLEDYFPKEEIKSLDIAQFLFEGFILKEKEFRTSLKEFDWEQYNNCLVALTCSTDAILPAWTYTLVASHLARFSKLINQGDKKQLLIVYYLKQLSLIDYSVYQNIPVILKGCSNKPVPQEVYVNAIQYLTPFAKSIMFGEACSAVPLFKK